MLRWVCHFQLAEFSLVKPNTTEDNVGNLRQLARDRSERSIMTSKYSDSSKIFALASECDDAFVELFIFLRVDRIAEQMLELDDLHDRFVDWSGSLGVFASGSAKLDTQLQNQVAHQDLICSILNVLRLNLVERT